MSKKWFPLEANPEVMNRYIKTLGVDGGVSFNDVFGLDDELLAMVPQPVLAVLLLYPITAENDGAVNALHEQAPAADPAAFFMKQTVDNACGTVGIVHAVANNIGSVNVREGSILQRFIASTKTASPAERAATFESDPELDQAQGVAANEGQTTNQDINAKINLHFICQAVVNGALYEFDGRKEKPLNLGTCTPEQLLKRAAVRAQEYMALNPGESNFSVIALCAE